MRHKNTKTKEAEGKGKNDIPLTCVHLYCSQVLPSILMTAADRRTSDDTQGCLLSLGHWKQNVNFIVLHVLLSQRCHGNKESQQMVCRDQWALSEEAHHLWSHESVDAPERGYSNGKGPGCLFRHWAQNGQLHHNRGLQMDLKTLCIKCAGWALRFLCLNAA